MRLFRANLAAPHHTGIPSALTSFVDEVYATLSRLFAYVATLALLGGLAVYLWQQLPDATATGPAAASWGLAGHPTPALATSRLNPRNKTETYEVFRHPEGDRKGVSRCAEAALQPIAGPSRADCVTSGPPAPSSDWVMGNENPRLRGAL
ncbi:hypothetical protein [Bradyrhizobium sp. ORS 111]|uniref:hypothetical protein n=1 Tax=Bradyrhizobium sp. ORS 111 TaxID=1685958 RepID=UPI003890CE12